MVVGVGSGFWCYVVGVGVDDCMVVVFGLVVGCFGYVVDVVVVELCVFVWFVDYV